MSDHLIAEANRHAKALPVNPDRLALALALQTIDELERENAALRISVNRLRRALLDCSDAAIGGSTLAMWIRGKVTATLSKEDGS